MEIKLKFIREKGKDINVEIQGYPNVVSDIETVIREEIMEKHSSYMEV